MAEFFSNHRDIYLLEKCIGQLESDLITLRSSLVKISEKERNFHIGKLQSLSELLANEVTRLKNEDFCKPQSKIRLNELTDELTQLIRVYN
ncbi:hypothetical protein ACVBOS_000902 [Vibrio vulnificus]|nr:hypothetical protein [Vibrio vulnificus]